MDGHGGLKIKERAAIEGSRRALFYLFILLNELRIAVSVVSFPFLV